MAQRKFVPFQRDIRRSSPRHMAPRHRPPSRLRRLWQRIADPLFYLRAVIAVSLLGLLALPFAADAVNAIARPATGPDGGCRVLAVIDGDTISLWCDGQGVSRARLTGYDTPEKFSPRCLSEFIAAEHATWALRWMIFQADSLMIVPQGTDRYDRRLISLRISGVSVARRMIEAGHGRAYAGGKRGGWCGAEG